jgi:hypothetical protein
MTSNIPEAQLSVVSVAIQASTDCLPYGKFLLNTGVFRGLSKMTAGQRTGVKQTA